MAKTRTSVGRGKAGKAVVGPGPVGVAKPGYFGDGPDGNDPGRPDEEALALVTEAMRRAWADEEAQAVRSLLEPCPLVVRTPPEPARSLATDLKDKLEAGGKTRQQDPPHLMVTALAGTGKTTTLVQGARAIKGLDPTILVGLDGSERVIEPSPQQQAIWAAMAEGRDEVKSLCFCAFNKSIATELQRRVPAGCDAMTLHSMGYRAVNKAFGYCRVDDRRVARIVEELTGKDLRELIRTEPGLLGAMEKLVGLAKMNLVPLDVGDPESQARADELFGELVAHYDIELEGVSRRRLFDLVPQVIEKCRDMRGRVLDFNDMIWLPVVLGLPLFKYDVLMIDESQDLNRCQQALTKMAGRRLVFCGDPCQPAGTEVTTPEGTVAIEDLKAGDQVVSYAGPRSGDFCLGTVRGITKRPYTGSLVVVQAGDFTARYTPNHHCYANFSPLRHKFCVYLMKRGRNYRVGRSKVGHADNGTGPVIRMRNEGADSVWVLSIHDSLREAHIWEQICTVKFGLPQLMFTECNLSKLADKAGLDQVWSHDTDTETRAISCLTYFGRDSRYPLFTAEQTNQRTMKRWMVVRACNLVDGCWVMPYHGRRTKPTQWLSASVSRTHYSGPVYSLTVDSPTRLYVGDGLVTHNCQAIYGFAGADARSMERLKEELGTTPRGVMTLPLTVTRRCGRAIVAEARRYVPEFEAHSDNGPGAVSTARYDQTPTADSSSAGAPWYFEQAAGGDFVLCRVNAPLVSQCFRFLAAGRKATIQGRDIGEGIARTIRSLKATSAADLVARLDEWLRKETNKEQARKFPSEAKLIALGDKHDCIVVFAEGCDTVEEVLLKVASVFTDNPHQPGIRLSSIHKAKGLEARRVFFLRPKGAGCPHPLAKTPWQQEQEFNILYVGITRAIEELVWVS